MYHLSFVHAGHPEESGGQTKSTGIRFSDEKAQDGVDAIGDAPGGLIDLSADCS
jgi:hypothetical protein